MVSTYQGGATRQCVSCGRSIDWNYNVCPYCGHDYRYIAEQPGPRPVSGGLRVLFYILSLFVWLFGLAIGIVYLVRNDFESRHVGTICLLLGVLSAVLWSLIYFWLVFVTIMFIPLAGW
jgi:hypothetical protein